MDSGEIELDKVPADGAPLSLIPRNKWRKVDAWLCHGDRRILWLPPEIRPSYRHSAGQHKGLFAPSNHSGKLTFIEVDPGFSPEGVP